MALHRDRLHRMDRAASVAEVLDTVGRAAGRSILTSNGDSMRRRSDFADKRAEQGILHGDSTLRLDHHSENSDELSTGRKQPSGRVADLEGPRADLATRRVD